MLFMLLLCREGEAGDVERVVQLDTRCGMTPALRNIRRETHFVKPDGEGLLQAINKLDGEEVKLVSSTTHATHSSTIQLHQAVENGVALHCHQQLDVPMVVMPTWTVTYMVSLVYVLVFLHAGVIEGCRMLTFLGARQQTEFVPSTP